MQRRIIAGSISKFTAGNINRRGTSRGWSKCCRVNCRRYCCKKLLKEPPFTVMSPTSKPVAASLAVNVRLIDGSFVVEPLLTRSRRRNSHCRRHIIICPGELSRSAVVIPRRISKFVGSHICRSAGAGRCKCCRVHC